MAIRAYIFVFTKILGPIRVVTYIAFKTDAFDEDDVFNEGEDRSQYK